MKRATSKNDLGSGKSRPRAGRGRQTSNVNRILVGVRIEPRLVKVMKALAELHDHTLGELIERVFWNALEGQSAFTDKSGRLSNDVRQQIQSLKQVYGVDYTLEDLLRPKERS